MATRFLVGAVLVALGSSIAETRAAATSRLAGSDDPCGLLTIAEIRRAFPDSKPGKLDRSQEEKYGIVTCRWDSPTGSFGIMIGDEAPDPARQEAETWTLMFLDPVRRDAARHVRYEVLPGVGDEAIAVVEREDKAKGFIQNGALLVVRRGQRQITATSTDLARRDRAEALKVLDELGRAIAGRLE
jgi:hypothetical protein